MRPLFLSILNLRHHVTRHSSAIQYVHSIMTLALLDPWTLSLMIFPPRCRVSSRRDPTKCRSNGPRAENPTKSCHWAGSTLWTWVYETTIPTRWYSSNANRRPISAPRAGQNGVFAAIVFTGLHADQGCGPLPRLSSHLPIVQHSVYIARHGRLSAQARRNTH
jgi:hypothetical protein